MRIALDVMGGDKAPQVVVEGAVTVAQEDGDEIILVGPRDTVEAELARLKVKGLPLSVVHASQVVGMDESPTAAIRQKRDSSIGVGLALVKLGKAEAFVSAGNSGAIMAAAFFVLGTTPGIERPALGAIFRVASGMAIMLDVGANADVQPSFMVQFGQMGSDYMERVYGIKGPRVALLNIGEEETKGNQLTLRAHALLKESRLNFIGNIEGKDLFRGPADVVVTDGFAGNIVVKVSEGLGETIFEKVRDAIGRGFISRMGALLVMPALREVARWMDYTEYGGAPLLGVNGVVIIGHGRSNAKAIASALRQAKRMAEQGT